MASPRTVYNLTVAGEHNYLVDGVLVHNKSTFRNTGGGPTGAATGDSGSNGSTGDSSAPSGHTGPGGTGPGGTGPSTTSGSGTPSPGSDLLTASRQRRGLASPRVARHALTGGGSSR